MSGDQTSRFSALAPSPPMNESHEVDREDERADEEDGGAQPLEPLGLAGPPAPAARRAELPSAPISRGPLIACSSEA